MEPRNLISIYEGAEAIQKSSFFAELGYKSMKPQEIDCLKSFCDIMKWYGCSVSDFEGFYFGYKIAQISKEFDLLRFRNDLVLNIELKMELNAEKLEAKVVKQLQRNYYYLKILRSQIRLFAFVMNNGFYEYDISANKIIRVEDQVVADCLKNQSVNLSIDIDDIFKPSQYLVSPFNDIEKFINSEFFLTADQEEIQKEVLKNIFYLPLQYYLITADAGTGKTLLIYDMAKELMRKNKNVVIIHCGMLNDGHIKLKNKYEWNIFPIKSFANFSENFILDKCEALFIDEAQRIRKAQLDSIVQFSIKKNMPIIFSYDLKQILKDYEGVDIPDYLKNTYPKITLHTKKLTNKIRTNKTMASFIHNLFQIGKSKDYLDYSCVSIEYINNESDLRDYICHIQDYKWTVLTFTTSLYTEESYDFLSTLSSLNAHSVIGQEFEKVACVLDKNFWYGENNKLRAKNAYYSPLSMLYQLVTRVRNELKIIVYDNPDLYVKLLSIKDLKNKQNLT